MKIEIVINLADKVWEPPQVIPKANIFPCPETQRPCHRHLTPGKLSVKIQGTGWNVGSMSQKARLPSRRIPLAFLVHTVGSPRELDDPDSAVRRFGSFQAAPLSKDPFPSFGPYWFLRDPYLHDQFTAECMVSVALLCRKGNGPDELTLCDCHRSLNFFKIALVSYTIRWNAGLALYGQDQVF
jgi:hypothetical protein